MELFGYIIIDDKKKQLEINKQKEIFLTQIKEKLSTIYNKYITNTTQTPEELEKKFTKSELQEKNNLLTNYNEYSIKIHNNKLNVLGKQIIEKNKFIINLSYVCIVKQGVKTNLEEVSTKTFDNIEITFNEIDKNLVNADAINIKIPSFNYNVKGTEVTYYYDHYSDVATSIEIETNDNLDIIKAEPIKLLDSMGELIYSSADFLVGTSIVNLLAVNETKYEVIKRVIDKGLDEVDKVNLPDLDWDKMFKRQGGNYADVYLNPDFSKITDGKIEVETSTQSTGIQESKQVWKGNYPLDRLIYTIQSNLDILMANRKINGDAYGNLYATLLAQAIQSATVLEQARLQAYEQASQFQIKSSIEYYLGAITAKLNVIKTIAETSNAFLQKSILQAQIKLYNIQTNGFKANNINKLFTSQFEGASTAFTTGVLDSPPAPLNNSDLMSLYTRVGTDLGNY